MKYIEKYPGLVYVNKTYIYAFGHPKKLDDFNFIERTNIRKKPKWDVINCKLSEPFNLKRFACILSNDEKILFTCSDGNIYLFLQSELLFDEKTKKENEENDWIFLKTLKS